jgi:hypothetical protein
MAFVYRELCSAIVPNVGLSHTLTHWFEIARGLAETPRQRKRQVAKAMLS